MSYVTKHRRCIDIWNEYKRTGLLEANKEEIKTLIEKFEAIELNAIGFPEYNLVGVDACQNRLRLKDIYQARYKEAL